ncbi:MAG: glutathione S-transferase [Polyangiaceae bacterium]|nr:glutathione S-transferase [Polyangiaceae bacterium]
MALLLMGNKNYSSWSIRPWFFIRHAGLAIEDKVIPLDEVATSAEIGRFSPSKRVPVLVLPEGDVVWDSLAIGEYLAETHPASGVWPVEAAARRRARSACAEMHSSFGELRRVLTCNKRARYAPDAWRKIAGGKEAEAAIEADIDRVHALWKMLLDASGGPFLCGAFGYVDAFFVPVVSRFATYGITSPADAQAYRARVEALPTYTRWEEEAVAETWSIEKYEYDIARR